MLDKEVVVNTSNRIDFLTDPNVHLYMPATYNGDFIHPSKSKVLECWVYVPGKVRERLPELPPQGLGLALLYAPEVTPGVAYSFYHCVEPLRIDQVQAWLLCLYREPEQDLHLPIITLSRVANA